MTKKVVFPTPPYYAVIFTSVLNDDTSGYAQVADRMLELATQQDGFIAFESARETVGISVSYWNDLESINQWKAQLDHKQAQALGRKSWYSSYQVKIAKVERAYDFASQTELKS